jgi:hypothetical protein
MAHSAQINRLNKQKEFYKDATYFHLTEEWKKNHSKEELAEKANGKENNLVNISAMEGQKLKDKMKASLTELNGKFNAVSDEMNSKVEKLKAKVASKKEKFETNRAIERAEWAIEYAEVAYVNAIEALIEADIAYEEAIDAGIAVEMKKKQLN